jgi:peptidoglycan-associated lipoprotein
MKKGSAFALALGLCFLAAGCTKKIPQPAALAKPEVRPEPPKPKVIARPIVKFFTAEPSTIERGQASTLRWEVTGADTASIDQGLGVIGTSPDGGTIAGNRAVFPGNTTSYTLRARNAGGEVSETVTVTVIAPAPKPEPKSTPPPTVTFSELMDRGVRDAYFDFDKSNIREDARSVLTTNADAIKSALQRFPNNSITVEGHCDERGSAEYNLGLGDRRAIASKEFLVQLGVPADRLRTLSYGKERPQCTEQSEECWQKNRRAHFAGQ